MQLESSPDVSTGFLPVLMENNGFSKTKPTIPPSREKKGKKSTNTCCHNEQNRRIHNRREEKNPGMLSAPLEGRPKAL